MTEHTSSADGAQAATSGSPQAGAPTIDGQAPVSQTAPTAKNTDHERIIEELRKENASHRKKLSAYEEAEKQQAEAKRLAEEAQLSEIDRVKKQHAQEQAEKNALLMELQEIKITNVVERYARELHFIYPEDVVSLLKRSELELDDDGTPKNVKQLLEKLAEARPKLVEQPESAPGSAPANVPTAPTRPGTPALPAMNPGRTQITPPGSLPPGKPVRLSDIRRR